jgi:hypothetical protein
LIGYTISVGQRSQNGNSGLNMCPLVENPWRITHAATFR